MSSSAPTTHPNLTILIIGAGLAGLSASIQCALAGHTVTIFESTPTLTEIGAGLQLMPNATRLLQSWGVYPLIRGPCEPKTCTVYNHEGKPLAHEDEFAEKIKQVYGAPFADCHRVDLQRALVRRAEELGVRVVLGARARSINFEHEDGSSDRGKKALVLAEGPAGGIFTADLVVGADGLWSTCRSLFLGRRDPPLPTGNVVYRIVLEEGQITDDEVRRMVKELGLRLWIGPDAHVVAYSLRGGTMYNAILLVPDDRGVGTGRTEGNVVEEMRKFFEGWDPVLTRILSCAPTVTTWKLLHRSPLPTFYNAHNNFVLVGDASHPMLPYLAQGASSSIEDGAVLGLLLSPSSSHFRSKADLPDALKMFERLRKERSEKIAAETWAQKRDWYLRDGEERRVRDERLERGVPCRLMNDEVRGWIFGYDAVSEVEGALGSGAGG